MCAFAVAVPELVAALSAYMSASAFIYARQVVGLKLARVSARSGLLRPPLFPSIDTGMLPSRCSAARHMDLDAKLLEALKLRMSLAP